MTQVSRPLGLGIATPGQVSMPPTPTGHHTSFNSAVTRGVSLWADYLVFPLRCVRLYVSGLGFKTELNISQDLTKLNIKLLIPLRLKVSIIVNEMLWLAHWVLWMSASQWTEIFSRRWITQTQPQVGGGEGEMFSVFTPLLPWHY